MKTIMIPLFLMLLYFGCDKESSGEPTQIPDDTEQTQETTEVGQYPIVDTNQSKLFNNSSEITAPELGALFYGQDAQFDGNQPSYTDNGDGTITDHVTGLIWQQSYEVLSYNDAIEKLKTFELTEENDWRIPSIKEAYSLIMFNGKDVSSNDMVNIPDGAIPFIDTDYFDFEYGSNGARIIDTQIMSSTIYVGKTMAGDDTVFGVNVADGRIKGYPLNSPKTGAGNTFTVRFVRGNQYYGLNHFKDNGDETITDLATGLVWSKNDSNAGMNWRDALQWVATKNSENYLGHNDWRLPNAKELQSIVDYSRSPQTTNSAAINPMFNVTMIKNEADEDAYPFYWSATTHENMKTGANAAYVTFGEALGFMNGNLMDVHGAGAQRSDPKIGDAADYPEGFGPQGDVIRILNYVRPVRNQ